MLVSMTPNDEVKTIHASLNDGSLRKWEFEPYTENGKIELTDQDYATIQSIKGNTVKFNQLAPLLASGIYGSARATANYDNGLCTYTVTQANTICGIYLASNRVDAIAGHKYLFTCVVKPSITNRFRLSFDLQGSTSIELPVTANVENKLSIIQTATQNDAVVMYLRSIAVGDTAEVKNFMIHDLTAMGIDNFTTAEQVETWLSNNIGLLPYYDYTEGSLISFNGTGLKTENASQTESNTLSLPISTYFPTGMKEAGSVYDEISDKVYTRVGSVDLGTMNWTYNSSAQNFYVLKPADMKGVTYSTQKANILCVKYITTTQYSPSQNDKRIFLTPSGSLVIVDTSFADATLFKNYLSGTYLFYELATPTSQDISLDLTYPIYQNGTEQILPVNSSTPTTSSMKATIEYPDRTEEVNFLYKQTTFESAIPQFSLVCKNQELPMALEDGKLICECDSSITNESGFFDCKVKMQDLNSVAYSQKIQLHVERGIND